MARAGQDVLGVASFHGNLSAPQPAKSFKAKIRVFHGADDKFVGAEVVAAFEKEMADAKADYVLVKFPGAVHSFTVKEAGDDPSKGMAYNADADAKSWNLLKDFLAELFAKK
jgi:dienelactone hydrolase